MADEQPLNILIVDDSWFDRELQAALLRRLGYSVDVARTGREGVNKALENRYGLILMDVEMPDLSGIDAIQLIRWFETDAGRVPIVVVSAHLDPGIIRRGLFAGMDDLILKPVVFSLFRSKMVHWLSGKARPRSYWTSLLKESEGMPGAEEVQQSAVA